VMEEAVLVACILVQQGGKAGEGLKQLKASNILFG